MSVQRQSDDRPLWEDFRPLTKIERPRVAFTRSRGIEEHGDGSHLQQTVLATEDFFHNPAHHERLLDTIGHKCGFGDAWRYQRLFFSGVLSRFFCEGSNCPAWLAIIPRRVTFRHRQDREFAVDQSVSRPLPLTPGGKLWEHRLSLGCVRMPGESLIMMPKPGRPIRETRITEQRIMRDIISLDGDTVISVVEHWCYLATPGDAEDEADARAARVPALRQFYDEERNIQRATLIDFCKLSPCGTEFVSFSFNLHPSEGKVLDFRSTAVPFEYYLRSGADSHALLRQATTHRCWDFL